MMQLSFVGNGNISPCPWKSECLNHPAGCTGHSYWCGRFDTEDERKQMAKAKRQFERVKNGTVNT